MVVEWSTSRLCLEAPSCSHFETTAGALLLVATIQSRGTCFVFQSVISMISSTAVPARDLLCEPFTRQERIVTWSAVILCGGAGGGALARSPVGSTTGNSRPAVKSHPILRAAEMYPVPRRKTRIWGHFMSGNTTTTLTGSRRVLCLSPEPEFTYRPPATPPQTAVSATAVWQPQLPRAPATTGGPSCVGNYGAEAARTHQCRP